jgi:hypothetical protein
VYQHKKNKKYKGTKANSLPFNLLFHTVHNVKGMNKKGLTEKRQLYIPPPFSNPIQIPYVSWRPAFGTFSSKSIFFSFFSLFLSPTRKREKGFYYPGNLIFFSFKKKRKKKEGIYKEGFLDDI